MRLALKRSSLCLPEGDPPDGTTLKSEGHTGSCRWQLNGIDSEVMQQMPEETKAEISKHPDHHALLFLDCPEDCHVRCFVRQLELNPRLGRWTLIEASIDPKDLQTERNGKAAVQFTRMIGMIAAYASEIDPDAWIRWFTKNSRPL